MLYATAVTANDGTGSFAFNQMPGLNSSGSPTTPNTPNYQCPTGVQPLMYVYSAGGNTTGTGTSTQNTAAAFLAPIGYCNQVNNSTFVDVSEVTTAATVAAVAQFINPNTDQIGNDGVAVSYAAMGNAFATIPNLVSAATGLSQTTTTIAGSGTGVSGVTMSVTAPTALINTIANILSACVNQATSSGANCNTLFTYAVPPASASTQSQAGPYNMATDTIRAALYLYLNPTSGGSTARNNLFNLQPAAGAPYAPALSSAPSQWLLPLVYTSANNCGVSGASTFLSHPYDLNVDVNGNVWVANHSGSVSAAVQIAPNGQPLTCVTLGSTASSLGGGVVDTNGSVWFADNAGGVVYAINPSSSNSVRSFPAPGAVAITADGTGNIFFTEVNNGVGSAWEILNAASVTNTSNPVQLANNIGPNPARIFPDAANDIWVSTGGNNVVELVLTPTQSNAHNYATNVIPVTGPTYGIMVGPNNRIYVTSQDANSTVTILQPPATSQGSFSVLTATSGAGVGGLNNPTSLWIDGAQNLWIGNNSAETSGTYALTELTSSLAPISATGTNGGFQSSTLSAVRATVVDPIGNVWTVNDGNYNSITVFLGAAVPIEAPYAQASAAGRFQAIP